MRAVILAALALVLVLGVSVAPASAETTRRSYVCYNGACSSLNLTFDSYNGVIHGVWAGLVVPAVGYCATAWLYRSGEYKGADGSCDWDRNRSMRFYFSNYVADPGDVWTVKFSDPWTVYDRAHPTIRL